MDTLHPDRRALLLGAAAVAGVSACSPKPDEQPGGFSEAGLGRLKATLEGHVAKGAAPGLVALVSRGGQTHMFAIGTMTLEGASPVQRDSIFRIASMTKAVTAAVAMMLVEEGRLRLDEPVERLAPELADRRVLKRIDGPVADTVPATRPITLEDVLDFRLGWGIVFETDYPIVKAIGDTVGFGPPSPATPVGPDEWLRRLGKLPLMAQPGERWLYTTGSDLAGVLIARAAGKPLDVVFQERVLAPLGMKDTAFHVPPEKLDRLVTGYVPKDGKLTLFDPPNGMYVKPPAFPAGDSGLVSTAEDYAAFAQFLKTGLAPDGRRLLSAASLKAMQADHLTPAQRKDGELILGEGRGWGYGVSVVAEANPDAIAPGAYGWNGGFGTSWFTDPAKDLIAILLTQRVFDGPNPPQVHHDFWKGAYGALAT